MIQFKKLRLSGFKSFVEKTELEIAPGLTGIVGPNGCGKSNLVEALRWVMGETSAKRMRGGAGSMEDVIFNGTDNRPARNFAEVSLLLDNSSHSAPEAYNKEEDIEVVRKIERDKGSLYKVNGKTMRARDVQMLFADTVTGANSPALVSQGRVTAMINAKPQERRLILEESAGVSGLYVRRHEAELRLRAADQNLQRLDDLVGSMEGRLTALKKQARQAVRYRQISEEIKELERFIAYLEWRILVTRIDAARRAFGEAESIVAERTLTVTQLTKTQNAQAEELPALRKAEAESSAALQAQKLTLQRIEDQEKALSEQLNEVTVQLKRLSEDRQHEQTSEKENSETLERLKREESRLQQSESNDEAILSEKRAAKDQLEAQVAALESEYETLTAQQAEARASRQAVERQIMAEENRLKTTLDRKSQLTARLTESRARFDADDKIPAIKEEIAALEQAVSRLTEEIDQARTAKSNAETAVQTTREEQQKTSKIESEILTEIKTLKDFLHAKNEENFIPVLAQVEPESGFETALSRALGDTLMASTDGNAPMVWAERDFDFNSFPALPEGVSTLEPHIRAPKHLKAALSLIGVVDRVEDGESQAKFLKPGQSLVSRNGAYWRWDGLTIKAEAADRHALQLQQRNRLKELEARLPSDQAKAEEARSALARSLQSLENASVTLQTLERDIRQSETSLNAKRYDMMRMTEARSALYADMAKSEEALANVLTEIETMEQSLTANKALLPADEEEAALKQQADSIEQTRNRLTESRNQLREALRDFDMTQQEQSRRKARLRGIADESLHLQNRIIRSRERLKELESREVALKDRLQSLESAPKTMSADRESLLVRIGQLEEKRNADSDRLTKLEQELADTNRALKEAEQGLSAARETRAAAQATAAAGQSQLDEIVAAIQEQFEMPAEQLIAETKLQIAEDQDIPALEPFKEKRDKLLRDRDMIGPVNLRAEQESADLEKEVGGVLEERNDLVQAIAELREGIEKLNVEARGRLMSAFDHVNSHFQRLFIQLYGGGKAELKLIESDDPLNSGLEIYAQPPGKTLQSLSLLSGGEQTLASIALIFAMFLTNPSPICVLDEIDAPLDDANVDRVCDLLEQIAERGETRFLIITHHRLTMARMDRLYGVTMAERGVSQLVSVDLHQQMDFLEAAE